MIIEDINNKIEELNNSIKRIDEKFISESNILTVELSMLKKVYSKEIGFIIENLSVLHTQLDDITTNTRKS